MLRAFSSAVSGMQTQMKYMDTVANNIANVSTTAFKTSRARFSDMLYQTISSGSVDPSGNLGGTDPTQIGLGLKLAGVDTLMTQGALRATGNPLDTAIEGQGFFAVSPDGGNTKMYTRDGSFSIDQSGNLVNPSNGMKVLDAGGAPINIPNAQSITGLSIAADGTVNYIDATGAPQTAGPIGVSQFADTAGLVRQGDNLWQASPASGAATAVDMTQPGHPSVRSGVLEGSNVDLAQEFSNMIEAQRGFQASSRVITTSDEILQDLVNIKH